MWRETDGLTLVEALHTLECRGFRGSFHAAAAGDVVCEACGRATAASGLRILAQERVEGVSDPADEALLAGVRCPGCGERAALILAYGPRARRGDALALASLAAAPGGDREGPLRRA